MTQKAFVTGMIERDRARSESAHRCERGADRCRGSNRETYGASRAAAVSDCESVSKEAEDEDQDAE